MQQTITVQKIIRDIADLSDIYLDERCADYLKSQRGPLLTAINMADGEAVASTVTRGIQGALSEVGFKGHLTPDLLRCVISEPTVGVRAIHDTIDRRENALLHLSNFVDQGGRGAFAGAQRGPAAAPQPPQREQPASRPATPPPQRGASPASDQHRNGNSAPPPQRTSGNAPREVPAPSRDQRTAGRSGQAAAPHSEERDDNPFPTGRGGHQGGQGAGPASPGSTGGYRSSVSNLDEQRAARRSYASTRDQGRDQTDSPEDIQNRRREQKNVYGSKASIQFSAGMTKPTDKKPPRPTIYMEAARMLNAQARTYDWNNKIVLQLTAHELQIVTALLFGLIHSCKFSNHGHPGEDPKWFEFAHQQDQYAGTIKIATGKASDVLVCSMGAEDIGDVTAMFLRQCAEQMRIEQAAVPATLRVVAQAYNARNAAKGGSKPQSGNAGAGNGGGQRRYG